MKKEFAYPSYYTVIPSYIRYNRNLSYFEIVLYSEIVALSNAYGYTFASNSYFAKCFNTSIRTISRSISKMNELGLIRVEIDSDNANTRKIYINLFENNSILYEINQEESKSKGIDKNVHTPIENNVQPPIDKNAHTAIDNNVYHNNINKSNIIKDNNIKDNMSIKSSGLNNNLSSQTEINPFFKKRNSKSNKKNTRPDIVIPWLVEFLNENEGRN